MFFKALTAAVLFVALSAKAFAQDVDLNCNFVIVTNNYTCELRGVTIADDENANFVIGGQHLTGMSNADVHRVDILSSSTPFIISQIFTTFPNLEQFWIRGGVGLTRIQANAFANATNLRLIEIAGNNQLRIIHANAFTGASNVEILRLFSNRIETIHETAFSELSSLRSLELESNRIQSLHHFVFRSLASLEELMLSDNLMESIDGRTLANNGQITRLDFSRNRVNALGRTFLDSLTRLQTLNTLGNLCASNFWIVDGFFVTMDILRAALGNCFANFVEPPPEPEDDVKKFTLELRGSLIIRDENGNEIIRL